MNSSVTIEKYQRILKANDKFERIAHLLGITKREVERSPLSNFNDAMRSVELLLNDKGAPPSIEFHSSNKTTFYRKPFNQFNLAEFIQGYSFSVDNDVLGLTVLSYRKVLNPKAKIDAFIFEDLDYFIDKRRPVFCGLDWKSVKSTVIEFYDFRDQVLQKYYEKDSDDLDNKEEDEQYIQELDRRDQIEIENERRREKLKAAYMWEKMIFDLAGGDVTKFETVLNMNVVLVFNLLNMKKTFKI